MKRKTTEQFEQEMSLVNPNIQVLGEYVNSTTKISIIDKSCRHEWDCLPLNLLMGSGCPKCAILGKFIDKTGEINYNNVNEKIEIINYINRNNLDVKFEDGTIVKNKTYNSFKSGNIRNPYDKSVFNVGYIGEGEYNIYYSKQKYSKKFMAWKAMLKRCYNEKFKQKNPTYKDCSVCNEWHNYQVFAKWYDDNFYEINDEVMALDKDILVKGNKVYSPNNCVFVPERINSLFTKNDANRGEYPIGVYFDDDTSKFISTYRNSLLNSRIYLGSFLHQDEAFQEYKLHKEKYIKEVADYYKEQIPIKLYEAMYKYEVEITD